MKLTIPVPASLQQPLPGFAAATTDISATIAPTVGAGRSAHSLLGRAAYYAGEAYAYRAVLVLALGGTLSQDVGGAVHVTSLALQDDEAGSP